MDSLGYGKAYLQSFNQHIFTEPLICARLGGIQGKVKQNVPVPTEL